MRERAGGREKRKIDGRYGERGRYTGTLQFLDNKGQCRKRELSDSQSAENHTLQAASAAPTETKLSVLLFLRGACTVGNSHVSLCASLSLAYTHTHMHMLIDKTHFFTLGISFDQQWLINQI